MNHPADGELGTALALTLQMSEAAAHGNWELVVELDARRQVHLQQARPEPHHRETLLSLQAHNRLLLEQARQVQEAVEQQLSQHQYNHRALRSYITSAG